MSVKLKKKIKTKKTTINKKVVCVLKNKKNIKVKKVLPKLKLKKIIHKEKTEKPIGKITHFYGKIKVAVVKFNQKVSVGAKIRIKGANTDFNEIIKSMEYDHKKIKFALKGKLVGIKVHKIAKVGDLIYKI
jgi:putative protease